MGQARPNLEPLSSNGNIEPGNWPKDDLIQLAERLPYQRNNVPASLCVYSPVLMISSLHLRKRYRDGVLGCLEVRAGSVYGESCCIISGQANHDGPDSSENLGRLKGEV